MMSTQVAEPLSSVNASKDGAEEGAEEWTQEWQMRAVRDAAALLRALRDSGEEGFAQLAERLSPSEPLKECAPPSQAEFFFRFVPLRL